MRTSPVLRCEAVDGSSTFPPGSLAGQRGRRKRRPGRRTGDHFHWTRRHGRWTRDHFHWTRRHGRRTGDHFHWTRRHGRWTRDHFHWTRRHGRWTRDHFHWKRRHGRWTREHFHWKRRHGRWTRGRVHWKCCPVQWKCRPGCRTRSPVRRKRRPGGCPTQPVPLRLAPSRGYESSVGSPRFEVFGSIAELPREAWNALLDGQSTPFVDWRWLAAMEESGCASERSGWTPRHLTLWKGDKLVAAAPGYVKDDSDGDFSRDWISPPRRCAAGGAITRSSRSACRSRRRRGGASSRLRTRISAKATSLLLDGARGARAERGLGTVQVLFPNRAEAARLESLGLARRVSYQFHWHNDGYATPADFLARFNSKRRAHGEARARGAGEAGHRHPHRARRRAGAGARQLGARWRTGCIDATVEKLMWGRGWLNQGFYEQDLRDHAREARGRRGRCATASSWPARSTWPRATASLRPLLGLLRGPPLPALQRLLLPLHRRVHPRGVQAFEGGAGGEHKLARGFLPTETYSAHLVRRREARRGLPRAPGRGEPRARRHALARWNREVTDTEDRAGEPGAPHEPT